MAITNHERVGKALDLLNEGIQPFVEQEMKAHFGDQWVERALDAFPKDGTAKAKQKKGGVHWDSQALLSVLWNQWNSAFSRVLGNADRNHVAELRDARNRWAHQERFSSEDAHRTLDTVHRLLQAVSAADEAAAVDKMRRDLLRTMFDEEARSERRRVAVTATEGQPLSGFKPWREVVTPHPDVASGQYQLAEFAADLGQVHRGEGSVEYADAQEFFRRTFLTEGLKHLLKGALVRLAGKGGDPVFELQTNFGGGKTHSMLALYHLLSGNPAGQLQGIEELLHEAGVKEPPKCARAVLVGTALSPAKTQAKPDGTVVRTLWGEMAWQLAGKKGYKLVAEADQTGVSPGSDSLRELFKLAAPCLVLIDEWVAFVRQLYDVSGLPAGSFDANLTFAQALTEAARAVDRVLVVATLPSSDIEIGGEAGKEALARLSNTFQRVETAWRPASAEESFEIVRRRLFQPISDPDLFAARDAVARAFVQMYGSQAAEFPSQCREATYERRIKAAYPIHPELFDRLHDDWSSLDRFQRTRGILRLMAAVIHCLWERQDGSLLILPGTVPIDDLQVQSELTRYLPGNWSPVIEADVDGPSSLPLRLDRDNPNLGRYSATRRVARTVYMGSAPTLGTANRGLEDQYVRLGCTQPGEAVATFGDALRRLSDQATHLYVDGKRSWYDLQPTVTRLAQDRATQRPQDDVWEEIRRRISGEQSHRGEFARVVPCPQTSGDVPDEREARLVVLGPEHPHTANASDSPGRQFTQAVLEQRGTAPRLYRNTLVFLAPDKARLGELELAVRLFLAWKSIDEEKEQLDLGTFQRNQAHSKHLETGTTVAQRVVETFRWLLVPGQKSPQDPIEWQQVAVQGAEHLAVRASRRLVSDDMLSPRLAGSLLRMELDRVPLWRGDHVALKQLASDFAQYPYLPRLTRPAVLERAVEDGLALLTWQQDSFAVADGWNESEKRYVGVRLGVQHLTVSIDSEVLVVKSEAAIAASLTLGTELKEGRPGEGGQPPGPRPPEPPPPPAPSAARRFFGSAPLNPLRVGLDASRLADEVIKHLTALPGAKAEVTLEIHVEVPGGVPDAVQRIVRENCRTLGVRNAEFESE